MNQPEQIRGVDFQSRKAFKAFIQFSLRKAASKDEKFPSLEDLHVVWLLSEPTQMNWYVVHSIYANDLRSDLSM